MEISGLLDAKRVALNVRADCSKAVFRCVGELLAPMVGLPERTISNALIERERLGSTALGEGISIPHARLTGIEEPQAFFIRLSKPVDMDAVDDRPVDLFFILLVPEEADKEHLRALSRIARVLRAPGNIEMIRQTQDASAVASLLSSEA